MQFFITSTDTNIGKTLVSSWLCAHTGYDYFKPIQAGTEQKTDTQIVSDLAQIKTYPENYVFQRALSPHLAAKYENRVIDIKKIQLPNSENLLVEGAGGIMVPINDQHYVIDLIKQLGIPVIIVSSTKLGTINHTLLTIESIRNKSIPIKGVIMSGEENLDNLNSIKNYGNVEILGSLPLLQEFSKKALLDIPLSNKLKQIFDVADEHK